MYRTIRSILAVWLATPFLAFAQSTSYEGLWWNSPANSESGWGINLTHQGNILFATWFTYDRQGAGMWLVMPQLDLQPGYYDPYYMTSTDSTEYAGTCTAPRGRRSTAPTFPRQAPSRRRSQVRRRSLSSTPTPPPSLHRGRRHAEQVHHSPGLRADARLHARRERRGASYQGLWWRSSESGWGVNLTHQGDIIFATWFTYDSARRGMWVVMPDGRRTGANAFTGALYRTTGPAFDSATWNAASVQATEVGTATFTFSDTGNGTFAYTVNGVSGSKPITRQVFSSPVTTCR
jgi:hypothetical protein